MDINDLMAAAQRAGVTGIPGAGGTVGSFSKPAMAVPLDAQGQMAAGPPTASVSDPASALMALLGQTAQGPQGGQMLQAITQLMGGAGGNGGPEGSIKVPGQAIMGNYMGMEKGAPNHMPYGPLDDGKDTGQPLSRGMRNGSPSGDMNQSNRKNGPTSDEEDGSGKLKTDPVGDQLDQGQRIGNTGNGMSTEQELEMTRKAMGAGDEPSKKDIQAVKNGDMTAKEFDNIYGKGLSKEYIGDENDNADQYDGDSEYR